MVKKKQGKWSKIREIFACLDPVVTVLELIVAFLS